MRVSLESDMILSPPPKKIAYFFTDLKKKNANVLFSRSKHIFTQKKNEYHDYKIANLNVMQ